MGERESTNKGIGRLLLAVWLTLASVSPLGAQQTQPGVPPNATQNTASRGGPIGLQPAERIWLARHPVLRYAIHPQRDPLEFSVSDRHEGMTRDLLGYLSQRLGLRFELVPTTSWFESLQLARRGKVDLLPLINASRDLEDDLLFSRPWLETPLVLVAQRDRVIDLGPDTLAGRKISVSDEITDYADIGIELGDAHFRPTNSDKAALLSLSLGMVDGALTNLILARNVIAGNAFDNLEIVATLDHPDQLRMAVSRDRAPLLPLLDRALAAMPEETLNQMRDRWLPPTREPDNTLALEHKLLRWIEEYPVIRLGADPDDAPFGMLDAQGHYQGMIADHLALLSKRTGLQLKIERMAGEEQLAQELEKGELDAFITKGIDTSDMGKAPLYTRSLLSSPLVVFARESDHRIQQLDDLADNLLALPRDSPYKAELASYPRIRLLPMDSPAQAMAAVVSGAADGALVTLARAPYLIDHDHFHGLRVATAAPWSPSGVQLAIRSDWPELKQILDQAIESLTPAESSKIRQRWTRTAASHANHLIPDWLLRPSLWMILLGALVLSMLLVLLLYHHMRRAMKHRGEMAVELESHQQQLRDNNEVLRSVLDNIKQGLWAFDRDLRLICWNRQLSEVRGYPAEMLTVGRPFIDFMRYDLQHGEFYDAQIDPEILIHQLVQRAGRFEPHHFQRRRAAGSYIEVTGGPIPGGGFVSTYLDVSERMRAEEALLEAKQQAEQANRLKSRFLANVGHEIRTPMNAIISMSHLVRRTALDSQQQDYVRVIQMAAHRLLQMINDLLDSSMIETGRLVLRSKPFTISDILDRLQQMYRYQAEEKGLALLLDKGNTETLRVIGDAQRLEQILSNLLNNALKFTHSGQIELRASRAEESENGEGLVKLIFSVRDTGIGIPADTLERVLQPFEQGDDSDTRGYGGSGLGLSICNQLVERMNGSLRIESQPNLGTTVSFNIHLPPAPVRDPLRNRHQLGLRRVLVIDLARQHSPLADQLDPANFLATSLDDPDAPLPDDLDSFELVLLRASPEELPRQLDRLGESEPHPPLLVVGEPDSQPSPLVARVANATAIDHPKDPQELRRGLLQALSNAMALTGPVPEVTPSSSSDAGLPNLSGRHILLVDDERINRRVVLSLLQGTGVTLYAAANGEHALAIARSRPADLVLMDIQMPEMNGYETTLRLRRIPGYRNTPVVAITAHSELSEENTPEVNLCGLLTKPISPESLYSLLVEILGTSPPSASPAQNQRLARIEASSRPQLPQTSEYLDVADGLHRSAQRSALYVMLLGDFLRGYADFEVQLGEALEAGEMTLARRLTHSLAGATSQIGASTIGRSARRVELQLADDADVHTLGDATDIAIQTLLSQLRGLLDQLQAWHESVVQTPRQVSGQSLKELLDEIEPLITAQRFRALDHLDELDTSDPLQAQLHDCLTRCDFNTAALIAKELREQTRAARDHVPDNTESNAKASNSEQNVTE